VKHRDKKAYHYGGYECEKRSDIDMLMRVQRHFTKRLPGMHRLSYEENSTVKSGFS